MGDLITLVLPTGDTHSYPICSHGQAFDPYREDPRDPASPWLVDVTPEAANELMHKGGFYLHHKPEMKRRLSGETTPLVHADGPASVSFESESYESAEQKMPNGTVVHVIEVPSEAVLDIRNSHPGFSVLSIADYQPLPEDDASDDESKVSPPKAKRGKREAD